MMTEQHLAILSKSPWSPAIRREHALAALAADAGVRVSFIEQPADLRAFAGISEVAGGLRRGLAGAEQFPATAGVLGWRRQTLVPGHRGPVALAVETALLSRDLRRVGVGGETVAVAGTPWSWPALATSRAGRKVVDLADDWARLLPARATLIGELNRRIADEADLIVVASPELAEQFPGRQVELVRNGVFDDAVARVPSALPGNRRIVAAGTLSERFDHRLVTALMAQLPDWTLELYGQCRYAGVGDQPSAELRAMLAGSGGRIRWHGVVSRQRLGAVLSQADVLLVAHRPEYTRGQDSMKMYDYSATGRPVVCSAGSVPTASAQPPHLATGQDAAGLARAVRASVGEPAGHAVDRLRWAAANTWSARWREWSSVVLDDGRSLDERGAA